jgi:hypothetical protein
MSEKLYWDFPPTKRFHRRPRVEIFQPEESPVRRFRVEIEHRRPAPNFWPLVIVAAVALLLWRFKLGLILIGAFADGQTIREALILAAFVVVAIMRSNRKV